MYLNGKLMGDTKKYIHISKDFTFLADISCFSWQNKLYQQSSPDHIYILNNGVLFGLKVYLFLAIVCIRGIVRKLRYDSYGANQSLF